MGTIQFTRPRLSSLATALSLMDEQSQTHADMIEFAAPYITALQDIIISERHLQLLVITGKFLHVASLKDLLAKRWKRLS